jgi:VWFA-related protein
MANIAKSVVVVLLASLLGAQEPVFRSTTDLVLVDAQVINKKTKTSAGHLDRGDFQIYEDGVLQEIQYIGRDELPLSVALLFDLTDSVRPVLKRLGAGARAALAHLKLDDEVAVMDYAASARVLDDFTTDRDRTVAAIDRAANEKSDEAAFFNEAVFQAAGQLQHSKNPAARRVIIWLTDNMPDVPAEWLRKIGGQSVPKGQLHTEVEAIQALHESGSVVAPLLLRDPTQVALYAPWMMIEAPWRHSHPPGDAKKYAALTGGQWTKPEGRGVDERLAELIDDLRSRYTLGYRPSQVKPAGMFCKLRVALAPGASMRAKEWNVLARAGYYRR